MSDKNGTALVNKTALLCLPFLISSCAALELAQRADDLELAVELGKDFQSALQASESAGSDGDGSSNLPDGVSLLTEEEFEARAVEQGSASYVGYAGLFVPTSDNQNSIITAEADITIDFNSNTVVADFDDWIGGRVDDNYNPIGTTGGAAKARGDIIFENGFFTINGGDASFTGDVSGELTYKNDDYGIEGSLEGSIGSQNGGPESVAAVAASDAVITLNGEVVDDPDADFGFYGEIID
ncbi:hypothetical protein JQU17_22755 [Ponticoccus sp. SC2-23]|uniref:hypothetical protein n=1 Tax=Alexandriicola marinus TaxID=2081710 RepID=UPI000FD97245|nr:hypothetical protein [Alexandriicola marinus]MBM1223025.1 hypothetical protein [Ponticoccus sp. SC6-9]MBM1227468.1 hypothetical protein [Ponticoccus sp. SC6-15]MBM1231978.1 hypothetical protein [Ponticoccus sp. SC6-38]MBM1236491.1 hypothetical protein [Ponticoccus sp. SC6-45]MBM1240997.1 hypothetical protein [Ponticoccus sp. SC6-49]MBM1245508.1 hypothetical protein [Ponticoccus sp. SC2-64]MBM1250008.1 hypothetical protein [Ponticoccus sp. SC6-42]MBM1254497.1 hypothetical protein [Pontico